MSLTQSIVRPSPPEPPPTHCRVAEHGATGSLYDKELAQLLQARLRIVALISVVPLLLFLVRTLIDAERWAQTERLSLAMHAGVTLLLAGLATYLWAKRDACLHVLRRVELALFASIALFFCWLQVRLLGRSDLFETAARAPDLRVVQSWIANSATRWFFLIVIYGVFIPNNWKRCAMLTGLTALMPLALTPLSAYLHRHVVDEVGDGLLDLCILMGTAWSVAVFGAHRLQMLQREAFKARTLGQYRLGRRLGSGGMGEVFEAEHVLLRRRCAIKLIRPDQMRDPATLQRFEREVQTMATLTHWNTAEVYDYGRSDDGTFYYVMEYLDGLTLETLVAHHGPLPPARAIHFLRQVCEALREAHGVGLLHRDVKPSNIIACKRGGVYDVTKLLDFGLVQQTRPTGEALKLTMQGAILGSPPYMSPEQAAGRQDLDARSDIYSLGGVGYYLLTGQPPFLRETAMEMMLAHAYEPAAPPSRLRPGLPGDLQGVLLRCLSKKADERYPDVVEMEKALAACCDAGAWSDDEAAAWWASVDVPVGTIAPEGVTVAAAG